MRLTAKTERALAALARRRGQSRSDVVREALEHYTASHETARGDRPYEAWLDVIGIVDLGARDPSRTTGEQLASLVHKKARARRPR